MKLSEFIDLLDSKKIPLSDVKEKYLFKSLFYNQEDLEKAQKMDLDLQFLQKIDKKLKNNNYLGGKEKNKEDEELY